MELQILHSIQELHNPVLNAIMYFFTCIGEYGAVWIAVAILMLIICPKKFRKVGLTVLIALIISLIMCNGVMKNIFQRVRPFITDNTFEELYNIHAHTSGWSFPSGHTSASFAAAIAILMWNRKTGLAALAVAICISFSRLYFAVHYPTDVLTSIILGSIYGVASYFLVKLILKKSDRMKKVFAKE